MTLELFLLTSTPFLVYEQEDDAGNTLYSCSVYPDSLAVCVLGGIISRRARRLLPSGVEIGLRVYRQPGKEGAA